MKLDDLTGQRFGKLTVVSRAENYVGYDGQVATRWNCRCDCGRMVVRYRSSLKKGSSHCCPSCHGHKYNDLSGQRFGMLTVLERDYEYPRTHNIKNVIYKCRCDCGKVISTYYHTLMNGRQNCGCK